jgi:hypothetical protein
MIDIELPEDIPAEDSICEMGGGHTWRLYRETYLDDGRIVQELVCTKCGELSVGEIQEDSNSE